jgi:hypothetical protein
MCKASFPQAIHILLILNIKKKIYSHIPIKKMMGQKNILEDRIYIGFREEMEQTDKQDR